MEILCGQKVFKADMNVNYIPQKYSNDLVFVESPIFLFFSPITRDESK